MNYRLTWLALAETIAAAIVGLLEVESVSNYVGRTVYERQKKRNKKKKATNKK